MLNLLAHCIFCALHKKLDILGSYGYEGYGFTGQRMRHFLLIVLSVFAASTAAAQSYPAPANYPAPQSYPAPQQVTDNTHAGQPAYNPDDYVHQPQAAPQPRPSDYGQSMMTDIRQMNF